MAELPTRQRLELAVRADVALRRGDRHAALRAIGVLYDATSGEEPAAQQLFRVLAARSAAQRRGASAEKLSAMTGMAFLAILAWIGVDRATYEQAVQQALIDDLPQ
jgi:hypothetical protein